MTGVSGSFVPNSLFHFQIFTHSHISIYVLEREWSETYSDNNSGSVESINAPLFFAQPEDIFKMKPYILPLNKEIN
jgi:hypothetical protein